MEAMLAQQTRLRMLSAETPEAGLQIARTQRPDLILLDIQLPGIDGYEVLRRLRAEDSDARHPGHRRQRQRAARRHRTRPRRRLRRLPDQADRPARAGRGAEARGAARLISRRIAPRGRGCARPAARRAARCTPVGRSAPWHAAPRPAHGVGRPAAASAGGRHGRASGPWRAAAAVRPAPRPAPAGPPHVRTPGSGCRTARGHRWWRQVVAARVRKPRRRTAGRGPAAPAAWR